MQSFIAFSHVDFMYFDPWVLELCRFSLTYVHFLLCVFTNILLPHPDPISLYFIYSYTIFICSQLLLFVWHSRSISPWMLCCQLWWLDGLSVCFWTIYPTFTILEIRPETIAFCGSCKVWGFTYCSWGYEIKHTSIRGTLSLSMELKCDLGEVPGLGLLSGLSRWDVPSSFDTWGAHLFFLKRLPPLTTAVSSAIRQRHQKFKSSWQKHQIWFER